MVYLMECVTNPFDNGLSLKKNSTVWLSNEKQTEEISIVSTLFPGSSIYPGNEVAILLRLKLVTVKSLWM